MEEREIKRVRFVDSFTRFVLLIVRVSVGKKEPVQIFVVTRGDEETKSSSHGHLQENVVGSVDIRHSGVSNGVPMREMKNLSTK